jgi:hypothetical protein
VSRCANCGYKFGLKQPIWWWNLTFCSFACKTLYKTRWRHDLRKRPISTLGRLSPSQLRWAFMRSALLISTVCFIFLNGTVLLDQWITGASLQFMLGTTALIAGMCAGLFAAVAAAGLAISRRSPHARTRRTNVPARHGMPGR